MMAAGVKPEAVTIDKLLGKKPKRMQTIEAQPELSIEEIYHRLKAGGEGAQSGG